MMRNIIILVLLIGFSNVFSQQSGTIEYKVKRIYNPILDKLNFSEENPNHLVNKRLALKHIEADSIMESEIVFLLKFKDNKTLFKAKEDYDSISREVTAVDIAIEDSEAKNICHIDYKKKLQTKQFYFWFKDFLIKDKIIEHNWEIVNETKVINGYNCRKAIIKKYDNFLEINYEIVAWFTPEINVSYGPLEYNGLPGLILRLDTHLISYYATKINLNDENIQIGPPYEGRKMTSEEFEKEKDNIMYKAQQEIIDGNIK